MVIEVKDLYFYHQKNYPILKGITFTSKTSNITAILGPNGSGKTTLFKCMLRLWEFQQGEVFVNHRPISSMKRKDIARHIALVPQEHRVPFSYSVFDVVLLGRAPHLRLFSAPSQKDREEVKKALSILDIIHLSKRRYNEISGGEKQLVLIARCLVQDVPVMLLDEPTAHLDFRNQIIILKKIKELVKKQNLTAIITLHDPNIAMLFADKVILLNRGKILGIGNPNDVINKSNIKLVYGIDVDILSNNGKKMIFPKGENI